MAFSQGISHCTEYISKFLMKHRKLPFERDFTTILNTLFHCADFILSLIQYSYFFQSCYCLLLFFCIETQPNHNKIFVLIFRHCNVITIWDTGLQIDFSVITFWQLCTCAVKAHQHWISPIFPPRIQKKLVVCSCASVLTTHYTCTMYLYITLYCL